MQIAFHLGAHCTDDDRLVRALMKNSARLLEIGVVHPLPRHYRIDLRDRLVAQRGEAATEEQVDAFLAAHTSLEDPRRMIFCHDYFMGVPARVLTQDGYYPHAGRRLRALRGLMPEATPEFFIGLRNPATQLPALAARIEGMTAAQLVAGHDTRSLRWAPVIEKMVSDNPGVRIVVWANEDMGLIWPEVLRALAGVSETTAMEGDFDLISTLISADGLRRLTDYLASHPPPGAAHRRKVFAAFLEKFALPEAVEQEIAVPGWSIEQAQDITAAYEADLMEISALPGVQMIAA